jgi:hypothetical protein
MFDMESQMKKKPLKIKKNTFYKIVLEIFSQFKNTWPIVSFKNYYTLIYMHSTHPSVSSTTEPTIERRTRFLLEATIYVQLSPWHAIFALQNTIFVPGNCPQ